MSKPKKVIRKKHDQKRVLAVKKLQAEYGYTPEYIRQCIHGKAHSDAAVEIKKKYERIYAALEKALA